tara:strand:- start:435 stop:593 length:159 start_codon:yes stop_codon:yes gene_type:complete
MKIFDFFTFNDENKILEIGLNELNKYIDFIAIVKSEENHQRRIKGKKIDNNQ